uniref:Protein kinase domain-containing protein n=1 Tax=Physcomitrium patens TaxID=3218 RepID=A0A7I4F9E8_PHYPA
MAGMFLQCKFKLHRKGKSSLEPRNSAIRGGIRGRLCAPWSEADTASVDSEDREDADLVHLDGVLSFNLEALMRASAYVLGKSGVGIVYKAVMDGGIIVAVRRLGEGGEQKCKEFEDLVRVIHHMKHPHVVRLHSYYWAPDEKLLIYDYLSNGSLETALHGRTEGPLPWDSRLRICKGAALGIAYIHECSPRKHVHGDIKPNNILLDNNWDARISDFGLQRLLSLVGAVSGKEVEVKKGDSQRGSSVSPAPIVPPAGDSVSKFADTLQNLNPSGTFAELGRKISRRRSTTSQSTDTAATPHLLGLYQAPETATAKKPNQKSDVYSFGVVLLEVLTGRSPFAQLAAGELDLVTWTRLGLQEKRPHSDIFDPYLVKSTTDESEMIETLQVSTDSLSTLSTSYSE